MLYWTFPYSTIVDSLTIQAQKQGIGLKVNSLNPGLLGVQAKEVILTLPKNEGNRSPEPIPIKLIRARPALFPPGLHFSIYLLGGIIEANQSLFGKTKLTIQANNINLSRANFRGAVGLDLAGKLQGHAKVTLDKDASKLTGGIYVKGEDVVIHGGSISNFDLPKIKIGQLESKVIMEKSRATVDITSTSSDGELFLNGSANLNKKLLLSTLNLKLKFKLSEAYMNKNPMIQTGLHFAMASDSEGYYSAKIGRILGNPLFRPRR